MHARRQGRLCTAAAGVLVLTIHHGLRYLAQQEQEGKLVLTEGSGWAGGPCRVVDDEIRRRVGEELGDGVDAGLLQALGVELHS
jgi:hypothetical protein